MRRRRDFFPESKVGIEPEAFSQIALPFIPEGEDGVRISGSDSGEGGAGDGEFSSFIAALPFSAIPGRPSTKASFIAAARSEVS